jgi:hypothetical protein
LRNQVRGTRVDGRSPDGTTFPKYPLHNDLTGCCCHGAPGRVARRRPPERICASFTKWLFLPSRSRAQSLMPSSDQPTWKSTRSSSGPRRRTSNAEVNHAPFLLVGLAPILAGFSYGAGGFHGIALRDRRNSLIVREPGVNWRSARAIGGILSESSSKARRRSRPSRRPART